MSKCEHHETMIKRIEKLEEKDEKKEDRITGLERKSDVSDEKFNNIMKVLGELKSSVDKIATSLSETQKRPIDLFWKVLAAIVIAVILFGFGIN